MVDLRAERERKGMSLDEVSAGARIPAHYLDALERGDHDVLPPGPFLRGYRRQYLEFLGFDPETETTASAPPPAEPEYTITGTVSFDEVPLIRLVMAGFVLTLVVVLGLRLTVELSGGPETAPAATAIADVAPLMPPSSRLRIRAIEPTAISTSVDDHESFSGTLPAGEIIDLEGSEVIEVWAADLTTILITYNGERIEPLGNLSRGRRLVFVLD